MQKKKLLNFAKFQKMCDNVTGVIFINPKKVPFLFSCLVTASFLNMSQPVVNTLVT